MEKVLPLPQGQKLARRRKKKDHRPPWKRPVYCVWLVLALIASVWLTITMPAQKMSSRGARSVASMPAAPQQQGAPAGMVRDDGQAAGQAVESGRQLHKNMVTGSPSDQTLHGRSATARKHHDDTWDRLARRALMFGRLFLFVGLGALLGSIIEGRCWYRAFAGSLGRMARAARLPHIVGIAAPTAIASSAAADSMLVASHNRGEISNSALVAGGMINSYFSHMSHSMRVLYPVVAAIGLPGLIFFLIQFGGGALIVFLVLLWHRFVVSRREPQLAGTAQGSAAAPELDTREPLPWKETLRKGLVRAFSLLFRLACLSVPMILAMEWLIRAGALDFWDKMVPATVSQYFPEQLLTIMAAQLGGLIQSAAVSAGLMSQGLITAPQVLLAMLVASAASNPFRALRRNLPTALAIFPAKTAFIIVFGMQFARLAVIILAIVLLIFWMQVQNLV